MFNYLRKAGTTDVSVVIRIVDSTTGAPETAVTFETSGIAMEYRREGATSTAITEATLAGLDAAHADGGFLHIGNGYYRLDLPDAACAVGVTGVLVHGIVTGMVVIGCYIQLVTFDPFDTVRLGLTALPNAAADAAGGLIISDAGGLNADGLVTDVAATHAHASTIDGHITADYGATEKAAIDLLDDAAGGLADIHTDVGTAVTDIAAVHVHVGDIVTKLPSKTYLTGTNNADGDVQIDEATGELAATISSAAISDIASQVSTVAFEATVTNVVLAHQK